MTQTAAQAIIDTQDNVVFCKFDQNQDCRDAAASRARPPRIFADIEYAVAAIDTALRDIVAANAVSSQQAAGNSRLMLDAVGSIDRVACKSNNLALEAGCGADRSAGFAAMLLEVQQLLRQGAAAASELRSLAFEHQARVASAACLLRKIGDRVTAVEQLTVERAENPRAGDVTPGMPA